eukprot:1113340-Prymnesium_polylepis.1
MVKQAGASSKPQTPGAAVLQVWFSTTWEPSTETAFRAAVSVVRSNQDLYDANADVSRLLDHWAASKSV